MNKQRFLSEVVRQLDAIYRCKKSGLEPDMQAKCHCEGFMKAGVFLRLVTQDELLETIERVHLDVLGESVEDRRQRLSHRWPVGTIDYTEFEAPAFERNRRQR